MSYKLICLDVDGTLLNDEKRVPESVKESLKRAYSMGIRIALITGRMPVATELVEKELSIPCIKACNAGTYILLGEDCIHSRHLSFETAQRIYETFLTDYHIPLWIFQGRKWYVTSVDGDAWKLDFATDAEFEDWIVNAKAKSLFESPVTPIIADEIVTLSTCSYEFYNARFVLHGRLIQK